MKRVLICAGGPQPAFVKVVREQYDFWIGVDRGALNLVNSDLPLDVAFGDFDSVSSEEFELVQNRARQLFRFNAEKDDTDLQLALMYVVEQFPEVESIHIFGGLSGKGRVDHLIANTWFVHDSRFVSVIERIRWIESNHEMRVYLPGFHQIKNELNYRYLSIVSHTPVQQLKIEGAKYVLTATDFDEPRSLISNEFLPEQPIVTLSFEKGIMTVWFVADDH
ncbi:thiamine diphosphokinase [Aerococcaceae bacterium zg-B36]|uniref:thiamine diphosphokinase n=1 Tax=Aerococcaceae bacterium zg-252 TaxID=2796928 RepID=UPI001BD8B675|nr:thiamine diphosphokinase [Aerococcaceae bacterium zg-B36]